MVVVQCSSCGAKVTATSPTPGGTVDCSRCGESLVLPSDTAHADTVAAPHASDAGRTLTIGAGTGTVGDTGPLDIPGYEVLEEIGRGGMGVVYKARQLNPPRLVALKMILSGEHADPEQLARFRAEAEAIARLAHPVIAQIHQVGEWHPVAGGPSVPFLTLEYVAGPTLARRLASGPPVTPEQAAALVKQLAEGVHYAHQQGIVHRDLKPGNILLQKDEGRRMKDETKTEDSSDSSFVLHPSTFVPKIVDFGLAKPMDGFGTTVSEGPRTRTGAVMGTPSYMAPEQAAAKGNIGPPADVYALGAILYELLTGRPPFAGESTLETLIQVTKDDPEPPRRIRRSVPRDLETVCLTCLAKDPTRRYASAAALAADLGRFGAGEPVKVRPPGRAERLGRWARRRKEVVYLAGGAVLAAAIVLIVLLVRPEPQADSPVPEVKDAGASRGPGANAELGADGQLAEARLRIISSNNLKQLALGLHNMDSAYGELPPAAICDKEGKPLLSWRVAVLPYIELDPLYKQFKLDEPWDGPNNKKLIDKMPKQYAVEGKPVEPPNTTHYQAIVGPGTAWEERGQLGGVFGRKGLTFNSFTDGTSNTILLAEGANPVIWTKPDDLTFDGKQLPKFGGVVKGGFLVAMADGSVTFIGETARPENLRNALTRNGGEILPPNWESPRAIPTTGPGELRGRVTLNGKPILGAKIAVFVEDKAVAASLGADGSYSITVPAGEYRVAIVPGVPPKEKPWEFVLYEVPKQYTDPSTSGLKVFVRPGAQEFDIDLKGAAPKK